MIVECKECNKSFNKLPGEMKRTTNHFCTRTCAAIFNNKKFPKRLREGKCKSCSLIITSDRVFCDDCFTALQRVDWSTRTLGGEWGKRGYQRSSRLRTLSRNLYLNSDKPQKCIKCGYSNHIEVCHVKAIASFKPETLITEVNSLDNLIALCPNHHWEFDSGLIQIEDLIVAAKTS